MQRHSKITNAEIASIIDRAEYAVRRWEASSAEAILNLEVKKTIRSLRDKTFEVDPIAGPVLSLMASVVSSAYKRHGHILEQAIFETLRQREGLDVWREEHFQVPANLDRLVDYSKGTQLIGTERDYAPRGDRALQVDVMVFNKETNTLGAYEVKRGTACHDAGKTRSLRRDALCVQMLLKSYGRKRGLSVRRAVSHIIFYYGKCSLPPPLGLTGADLNRHFGFPVSFYVEQANHAYQRALMELLSGRLPA